MIRNLTKGYTGTLREHHVQRRASWPGAPSTSIPEGDTVAFFARTGKRRSLFLVSALDGRDPAPRSPSPSTRPRPPASCPDGQHVALRGPQGRRLRHLAIDLETRRGQEPHAGRVRGHRSPDLAGRQDRGLQPARRGPRQDLRLPARRTRRRRRSSPSGPSTTTRRTFSDGRQRRSTTRPTEDDDIYNLRSLDLRDGRRSSSTRTPSAATWRPRPSRAGPATASGLHQLLQGRVPPPADRDSREPMKEVDQEVRSAAEGLVDFQPDVTHQVVPENKRSKRLFERLYLEGRPPLNVGVTSSGDFFGGQPGRAHRRARATRTSLVTVLSVREFRSYDGHVHQPVAAPPVRGQRASTTRSSSTPRPTSCSRASPARARFATQRVHGRPPHRRSIPLDKFRRLEVSAGVYDIREQFENAGRASRSQQAAAAAQGQSVLPEQRHLSCPSRCPWSRRRPASASSVPCPAAPTSLSVEYAPAIGGLLSPHDRRRRRSASTSAWARLRRCFAGALSAASGRPATTPPSSISAGNMELRGYPYLSFSGNQGFFANVELRFPIINLMATPIGILGPVRGTLFAGIGGAKLQGRALQVRHQRRRASPT